MFRTALTNLAARKARLLTTGAAVVLGVAFMVGTLVLTATIDRSFGRLFAEANAGVDAYVRSARVTGEGMTSQRARLELDLVDTVRSVDGVADAQPTVQGQAQLLGADGETVGTGGGMTLAGNWQGDSALNPFTLSAGRAPDAPREAVIDRATAGRAGLDVGDRTGVLTQAGRSDVTIVGFADLGGTGGAGEMSYVLFDLATAQELLGSDGRTDGIRVAAEDGVDSSALVARLADLLPGEIEVLTGSELTEEEQGDVGQGLAFLNTFLMAFALISLFVGSFIIHNTFSILVAQRARESALLRAVGATRRQVLGSVLAEATVVGMLASAVGVVVGVAVAAGLKAGMGAMGIELPADGLVLTPGTVVGAIATGTVVSVVAAVAPARRAAKVAPVAALRGVLVDEEERAGRRLLVGGSITVVGAASMALGLLGGGGIAPVGLGVVLVFLGATALGPAIAVPVTRVLGAPITRFGGAPGRIASDNAMRNPRRTAATASALMVGVALVGTITVLAASAKASVEAAVRSSFTGDLVVDAGPMGMWGFSPEVTARLADVPGVQAVTALRGVSAEVDGSPEDLIAMEASTVDDLFDLGAVRGSLAALDGDRIALSEEAADELGADLGDTVTVRFAETGDHHVEVVAIYEKTDVAGDHLIGIATYDRHVATSMDTKAFVRLAPGADLSTTRAAAEEAVADHPQLRVQDRDEFAGATAAHIDAVLNLVYGLLLLAVLIAVMGIANTLALSVVERTRELGLMRAVGMTRRQVRAAVRWESVLVALLGAAMGLSIGTLFGWSLVQALGEQGLSTFVVPGAQLATITTLAALAGVGAAVVPARRAARLDVLAAVSSQ